MKRKRITKVYVTTYYFEGEIVLEVFKTKYLATKFKNKIIALYNEEPWDIPEENFEVLLYNKTLNVKYYPKWFLGLNS